MSTVIVGPTSGRSSVIDCARVGEVCVVSLAAASCRGMFSGDEEEEEEERVTCCVW